MTERLSLSLMMLDKKQIRAVFLFKFKWVIKQQRRLTTSIAHQPGTANERTVQWWFKKICKGDRALKKRSTVTSHWKLTVTNERIIDTDPLIVTQKLLTFQWSFGI